MKLSLTHRGFSLIEVMLVVAIMSLLAGLSVPLVRSNYLRNEMNVAAIVTAQTIRRAQLLAFSDQHESDWGVQVTSGSVTLFQGTSFATRDTSFDEVSDISAGISVSGVSEVVFSRVDGVPSVTGNMTLTDQVGDSEVLTINSKGVVSY